MKFDLSKISGFVRKERSYQVFRSLKQFLKGNEPAQPIFRAKFYRSFDPTKSLEKKLQGIGEHEFEELIQRCILESSPIPDKTKKLPRSLLHTLNEPVFPNSDSRTTDTHVTKQATLYENRNEIGLYEIVDNTLTTSTQSTT